jgi:hypothetical protein
VPSPPSEVGPWPAAERFVGLTEEELAAVDPVVLNLAVARGIPALADLEIGRYVALADDWAADIRRRLPRMEPHFYRSPADWKSDIRFFRLGIVCWYVDEVLKVTYPDDLADAGSRLYTDPLNVFVNGLMVRRRGSCANMPVLHLALGWRLGWPLSLACASNHLFCRYDDGEVTHNIEATAFGRGGFRSHPDAYYRRQYRIPEVAVACGSELRALTPREMLGVFLGVRAHHRVRARRFRAAEEDLLLARHLFPRSRSLYGAQMNLSLERGLYLFGQGEEGHPGNMARKLVGWLREASGSPTTYTIDTSEVCNVVDRDAECVTILPTDW